jgi:hypothetical protein
VTSASATFTFTANDPAPHFECRLDAAAFAPCASPASYTALASGQHTFAVRAIDATNNLDPTPATRTFTVVSCPPVLSGLVGLLQHLIGSGADPIIAALCRG